jgi:hypothetical protein
MKTGEIMRKVGEQVTDLTRYIFPARIGSTIRSWLPRSFTFSFWAPDRRQVSSEVNYSMTREIYRNTGDLNLGAGFAKPLVDLQVGFIGIPVASTEDEKTNDFLNECLSNFWVDEIQQMLRDSIRDSKTVVRIQRPDILDPLMTLDEAEHCSLEVIPPERVEIERDMRNKRVITRAVIYHTFKVIKDEGNPATGTDPTIEEHDVLEIITQQDFRFYDQTDDKWLTNMASANPDGFVPLLEVYHEWDSALQSGQSDFETVLPFMQAFNDVLKQGMTAHKYHSTPKVVMKLTDVAPFIKNNFPEAVDPQTGEIMPHAEISWRGREILFLQQGDDMTFLEAHSVLGDTNALLEFLIDCICVSSQTPEWAFMRVSTGTANSDRNAQTVPFLKKIERKRRAYQRPIQDILKMALVISNQIPLRAKLSWEMARVDDLVVYSQAFQQLVMGLEVAIDRGEISNETYQRMIKEFLPAMKSTAQEQKDIEADKKKAQADAQAAQAALPPPLITPSLSPNPKRPIGTHLQLPPSPNQPTQQGG